MGECFQTYSGEPFYPLDPIPDEVRIEDIAHALANICRFGGHCKFFYSVAQHSLKVSRIVPHGLELQALLHDGAEAFLGDMVKPFKNMMPEFEKAEADVFSVIAGKFGIPKELSPEVKIADRILLATEARDLMRVDHPCWGKWLKGVAPLSDIIRPLSPHIAEAAFIERFNELTGL